MAQVSYGTITITDTTDLNTFIRYAKQVPLQSASDFQLTPDTYTHYIAVLSIPSNEEEPLWNSNQWKWSEFIGTDGLSVKSTRTLYYLRTNSSNVPEVNNSTPIVSTDVQNAWTSINPTYVTNGTYWTCLEVTLSDNITKSWSTPVQDLGLTSSNATANNALTQAASASEAVSLMGGHFIYKSTSSGNSTSAGAGVIQNIADNPANWGYNTWIGSNGIQLRRGETADATLNANGLILANGGIKAGTPGQSGFIYLSTQNYGSYSINSSNGISDWKEIIGTKFGVRADGTLYANNAIISGQITVESGSDLSAGLGDYSTTTAMNTAISTATNDMATQTYVSNNYATQTSLNTEISQRKAQYGTSSTGASTRIKAVTCSNFELVAGNEITIKFSYANTQYSNSVQLNINNKGAKDVWVANAITSSSNQLLWGQNAYITFRYDGTQFIVIGEPRTWYGASTTPADTAAKTDTTAITGCVICKGAKIELAMSENNTSTSATLNIQSTGTKNIYYGNTTTRPTVDNGHSWLGTSTATFTFDGAYYRMAGQTVISGDSITTGTISANRLNISDIISKGSIAVTSQIPTDLSDLNNDTGYITSDSISGLATNTDAVYRAQRIYRRYTAAQTNLSGPTTWITNKTDIYTDWTTKIPPLKSGTTKYPYLYTATQSQTITQYNGGSGTACSCSVVLLDDTTTIIDGGAIIAGSVTANEITGSKLSAIYADMGNITAGNITKGYNSINFDNTPATLEFKNASSWSSATQGIRYNSDGLEIKGTVTATSLTLGNGVTIPASTGISGLSTVATTGSYNDLTNKPTIPSLTGYIYQNGTIGTTPAEGATGFVVSNTGLLQASNAVIYGSLYASKGYIGGWQIGTDGNKSLHNGNANTSPTPGEGVIILSKGITGPSTATGVLPANQNWTITAGNQFGVTTGGVLYANGAHIAGTIMVGEGSNVYTTDEINTNVTALRNELYGVTTYEYISNGTTYVVYSETDDNGNISYYYTYNSGSSDAPIESRQTVNESDLVHNADNSLKTVTKGLIAESFDSLTNKTDELSLQYDELSNKEDLSLISQGYAKIENDILTLFKQNSNGEVESALELTSTGIDLKAESITVATMRNDNGIGIMQATNMEQTFVKMIQSDGTELFQWIAQSNGHLSLKKL